MTVNPTLLKTYIAIGSVLLALIWYYVKKSQSMHHEFQYHFCVEPYLYFAGNAMSKILERCVWTTETYYPLPWAVSDASHLRLALSKAVPIPQETFERELLLATNSTTVAIDWFEHPEDIVKRSYGVVVFFTHGLNGELIDVFVSSLKEKIATQRLSLCLVTIQGVHGVAPSSQKSAVELSFGAEYKAATERITQHLGLSFPKTALALSLGGIPVIEFLHQEKTAYTSLILVSCPLDLGRFFIDQNCVTDYMLSQGKKVLKDNADFLTSSDVENVSKAIEATSLNEFLSCTLSRTHDQSGLAELFKSVEPYSRLDAFSKPTLMMYAVDDKSNDFISSVDLLRLCRNEHIAVCVTETGGHCGFQTFNPHWLAECICEFASSASKPVF
jgi:predicted alpha/beta-fold hydrolase